MHFMHLKMQNQPLFSEITTLTLSLFQAIVIITSTLRFDFLEKIEKIEKDVASSETL